MHRALKEYLPPILMKTYEFPLLCLTEQLEFGRLAEVIQDVFDAQFVTIASERGVTRREEIFGITPQDTDTISERRFRILTKVGTQRPYTMRRMCQLLAALCGQQGYQLWIDGSTYTVTVKVELTEKRNLNAVEELLHSVLPANLVCTCSLLYNQNRMLSKYTHAQLAAYTQRT